MHTFFFHAHDSKVTSWQKTSHNTRPWCWGCSRGRFLCSNLKCPQSQAHTPQHKGWNYFPAVTTARTSILICSPPLSSPLCTRNKQHTLHPQRDLTFRSKIEWLLEGVTALTSHSVQRSHGNKWAGNHRRVELEGSSPIVLAIFFILQVKKLRCREVNWLIQGHVVNYCPFVGPEHP